MKKNFFNGKKIKFKAETIYEIGMKNSAIGAAVAEIKKSEEHFHKKTKEWYYVIEGRGTIYIDDKRIPLKKNDFFHPAEIKAFRKGKNESPRDNSAAVE